MNPFRVLSRCNRRNKIIRAVVFTIVALSFVSVANAIQWSNTANGSDWDLTGWITDIKTYYFLFTRIALGLGAVSFAWGAIKAMIPTSDEKKVAQGIEQMKITIIAIAALFLLPSIVEFAVNIFSRYAWDPMNP